MDPASIVAFIGFGAQAVDGILRLKDFLQEVHDAPQYIQDLRTELDLLRRSLESFSNIDKNTVVTIPLDIRVLVQEASIRALQQINSLLRLLNKTLPEGKACHRRHLWSKIKAVLQKETVMQLIADLERAKSTLEIAQRILDRYVALLVDLEYRLTVSRQLNTHQTHLISNVLAQNVLMIESLSKISNNESFSLNVSQGPKHRGDSTCTGCLATRLCDGKQEMQNDPEQRSMATTRVTNATFGTNGDRRWVQPFLQQVVQDVIREEQYYFHSQRQCGPNSTSKMIFQPESMPNDENWIQCRQVQFKQPEHNACDTSLECSSGMIRKYNTMDILYGEKVTTIYHSAWVGTVTVSRAMTAHRTWSRDQKRFEKQYDLGRTSVGVQFAPWLSNRGLNIRLDELISVSGIVHPAYTLEPVRYIDIPPEAPARIALKRGDLATLQCLMSQGLLLLKDHCYSTGRNLLDISLQALQSDWSSTEMSPGITLDHTANIMETCTWLYGQGLRTELIDDNISPQDCLYLSLQDVRGDVHANVYRMERLLLESSSNASSLPRANRLLLFAILNPQHSKELEHAIVDLVNEGIIDEDTTALEVAERDFWCQKPEDFFFFSVESIILKCMVKLARASRDTRTSVGPNIRITVLTGARRVLVMLCEVAQDEGGEGVVYVANILSLCKPLSILDDGFGEHMSVLAYQKGFLNSWYQVLKHAGYHLGDYVDDRCQGLQLYWQALTNTQSWKEGIQTIASTDVHPTHLLDRGLEFVRPPSVLMPDTSVLDLQNSLPHAPAPASRNLLYSEEEFWRKFALQHEIYTSLEIPSEDEHNKTSECQDQGLLMRLATTATAFVFCIA